MRATAVLLDLDGTLLDTAPDLIAAANATLMAADIPSRSAGELTPCISGGAAAMLRCAEADILARGLDPDALLAQMLDRYAADVARHSRFYDGMERVLDTLDRHGIPWGIVTNKHSRFTQPLLSSFSWNQAPACVISGDTTPERKPHPLPLLEACRRLAITPANSVYVGDAKRDVEAGQRAGMATLVALYGYLAADERPEEWGADGLLGEPADLLTWLLDEAGS